MTTLLLLHGFTGCPSSWDAVRRELPGGLSLVCPVLVGHGSSPAAPEVESFEAEVDRLALAADGPLVVAGYSLGARLALGLSIRHRQRVRAAVLVSGSAGLEQASDRDQRVRDDEQWAVSLERDGLEAFVDRWQVLPLFATQRALQAELVEAERRRRLSHTAAGLARSLRVTGTGRMPSYASHLRRLDCPVELVSGALDAKFRAIGRELVEELPRARLTLVPAAGHNLLLERPDAVAAAILRVLASGAEPPRLE